MKKIKAYILIAPLILLGIIFIVGVVNGLVQSFGYIPAFDLNNFTFEYYIQVINNPIFLESLKLSLKIAIISSVIAIFLGTLLAASLVYTGNTEGVFVNIVKLAIIIPHTIVAIFIISSLSQNGLVARIFYNLGLISSQNNFPLVLYSSNSIGIILGYLWKEVPFIAYFSLSLMANIKDSLGEASENLGASKLQTFFNIILPLTMPAISKSFLIIFTFSFGAYDLPFLLGQTTPKTLPVMAHVEYMHPDLRHRPYAMAINGLILLIMWTLVLFYYLIKKVRIKNKKVNTYE